MDENVRNLCVRCRTVNAEVICMECGDTYRFCKDCDTYLHSSLSVHHKRQKIISKEKNLRGKIKSNNDHNKTSINTRNKNGFKNIHVSKNKDISSKPKESLAKIEEGFEYSERDHYENAKKIAIEKEDLVDKNLEFLNKIEDIRKNFDSSFKELKYKIEENDVQSQSKFNLLMTKNLNEFDKLLRIKDEEIFYLKNKVCTLEEIIEKGKNKGVMESAKIVNEYKQKFHEMFVDLQFKLKDSDNRVENLLVEKENIMKSFQEDKIKLVQYYEHVIEKYENL